MEQIADKMLTMLEKMAEMANDGEVCPFWAKIQLKKIQDAFEGDDGVQKPVTKLCVEELEKYNKNEKVMLHGLEWSIRRGHTNWDYEKNPEFKQLKKQEAALKKRLKGLAGKTVVDPETGEMIEGIPVKGYTSDYVVGSLPRVKKK